MLGNNIYTSIVHSFISLFNNTNTSKEEKESSLSEVECLLDFTLRMHNDLNTIYFETIEKEEEEEKIGQPDSTARYLNQIGKIALLSPEDELDLARRARNGDQDAKDKLITSNLRWVAKLASKYVGVSSLTFDDFVQEGNIG